MFLSITRVENKRIAKYASFETLAECEAHATEYNGIVYEGEYSPQLWVENGEISIVPIQEEPQKTIARLELCLDLHLDAVAKSYGYESIKTMVTYPTSTNLKFAAEGQAAIEFRDAVYTKGIELIADVQAGNIGIPTESELLALMPKFTDFLTQ